ncbi:hypothetical protein Tco_0222740 [Tanacetum coccineum]
MSSPVKKGKRVKRPAKKSSTTPTAGFAIRDTLGMFVSKKKAPAKADRSKGVPDVPKYDSESEDDNDDDSDDDSKGDNDKDDSDDGNSDADDNERTDSDDDDVNLSLTLKDHNEEEHDEEYASDDDNENVFEEEDDDLYKDVDVRSLGVEQEQERKGDEEMTDADQNVSQEKSFKQVIEDAHVILTSSQKTDSSKQSSFVSSDFSSKFLIFENVPLAVDKVASMMNVKSRREEFGTQALSLLTVPVTTIPETTSAHATTVPPTILMITPHPQLMTPSPTPITIPTTTSIPALLDFSSLFGFDQRVSTLEMELSQLKQANHSTQLLESLKSQLPTMSTINESLENVVLAKSYSQPKSTYEAAESLTEFELKKILLDKKERSESYKTAPEHKELYEGLVKSYNLDKDLFSSYGNVYSLKRDCDDKDKDEDAFAGSDRGLKKRKTSKDAEPSKGLKSKETKTSSSKGTKS